VYTDTGTKIYLYIRIYTVRIYTAYIYIYGLGQPYIYGVHTVYLAEKSPNIRSYTVYIGIWFWPTLVWHITHNLPHQPLGALIENTNHASFRMRTYDGLCRSLVYKMRNPSL